MKNLNNHSLHGILLVDKPRGKTSFSLVSLLRRRLNVQKIGHAGTLDPFATGVVVMLVGKNYTRLSDKFLCADKEYVAQIRLGIATDTYDCDGQVLLTSDKVPELSEIEAVLKNFQGEIEQIPPMFSAKKVQGKKLYELARQGTVIAREPVKVRVKTIFLSYEYPFLNIQVACSKGTYIRSIAEDIGKALKCGAHLSELQRIRSGNFQLSECVSGEQLNDPNFDISAKLIQVAIPA